MNLNDLLVKRDLDPQQVLVFRHRPSETKLNKVLPWLAEERPELFNAYQQIQGDKLESVMTKMSGAGYVASFIGHAAGKALFVGIYKIGLYRSITRSEFWEMPANAALKKFDMKGFPGDNPQDRALWFELEPTEIYSHWKGRLAVSWPPPERSWWRRAHKNEMRVLSISEDSAFAESMPDWHEITLSWDDLAVLPERWKAALSQWRGIYYIFDGSDGKGYVGSAGGTDNLYGRWLDYANTGHGYNKWLRDRDPSNFRFSILQRVSPDMETSELVQLENTWKLRLHTRHPHGLNDN